MIVATGSVAWQTKCGPGRDFSGEENSIEPDGENGADQTSQNASDETRDESSEESSEDGENADPEEDVIDT